jgi:SEC-C motif
MTTSAPFTKVSFICGKRPPFMLVAPELRDSVVFIGAWENKEFSPRATGFIVAVEQEGLDWSYLVTAQHVIEGLLRAKQDVYVRVTMKGRTWLRPIGPIPLTAWTFHPNNAERAADVAVAPIDTLEIDFKALRLSGESSLACTPERFKVYLGTEVAVIGLLINHFGKKKSVPVVRTGCIAALREEPVNTKCGELDAYLIEAMSVGGLSGSPVFVNVPGQRLVDGKPVPVIESALLGMMHGHFDVRDNNSDVVEGDNSLRSINTGIAVVIPAERIVETLAHPRCIERRREAAAKIPKHPDDPCYCNSGAPYKHCHGANIGAVHRFSLKELGMTEEEFDELRRTIRSHNLRREGSAAGEP